MLTSYTDFTHPDPAHAQPRSRTGRRLSAWPPLGAELLRVTAGQGRPETGRAEDRVGQRGLRSLAERTAGSGVTLAYENHSKPGVWTYTDFCEPPDIFREIAARTEGAGIGINFDVGNAATFSDDPVALLDAVLPRWSASTHRTARGAQAAARPPGDGHHALSGVVRAAGARRLGQVDLHGRGIVRGRAGHRGRRQVRPHDLGCRPVGSRLKRSHAKTQRAPNSRSEECVA